LLTSIKHSIELEVKFSEADPLGIVWHGHYIRYFEDGREGFGKAYGLRYIDLFREGIITPIVHVDCDYKRILRYSHRIRLETTFVHTAAAKILFTYTIYDVATEEIVAIGNTTQVFMDKNTMELMLTTPKFMHDWKDKWLKD